MIEADELVKTYPRGVRALDRVSFEVEDGTVFALLGPNGAGKSTTVKILTTLSRADSGEARVAGFDVARQPQEVRPRIGVVAQRSAVDREATGRENLILQGQLYGLGGADLSRRADELLERFGLADAAHRPGRTYSGGMQRRLDIAMGLMHRPSILFLDEPTTGLDPEVRSTMWAENSELAREEGLTILLTTHYLEEADELADRVALIDRGRVIAEGTPDELKRLIPGGEITLRFPDREPLTAAARMLAGSQEDAEALELHVAADGGVEALRTALDRLADASIPVDDVAIHTPDLDDVFLTLTDHTDREEAGR
jgi:ABC-2 type transport system ATP-binding protein